MRIISAGVKHAQSCTAKKTCALLMMENPEYNQFISYTSTNLGEDHRFNLVDTIAHEIFHRMQPYGKIKITQFEEFSAIYLAAKISGVSNITVNGNYNPLNPKSLRQWLIDTGAYSYFDLNPYPKSVKALVDPLG